MTIRIACVVVVGVFAWAAQSALGAQGSVNAGVYTAEQAKRGAAVYLEQCAACHNLDLAGTDAFPSLLGPMFLEKWKTVGDLYEKVNTTMPAYAPGSLTPAQTADVVAEILRANKYPAGSAELSSTPAALKTIAIEPAK